MHLALRIGCAAAVAAATTTLLATPAVAGAPGARTAGNAHQPAPARTAPQSAYDTAHAVFVQTDATAGNQIAAYREEADGALSLDHTYATGGLGGILDNSVVDHLASQGGVTYDAHHRLLYAVNAGSNSVSVFAVRGVRLRLVQVVSSAGSFPVSVAVNRDTVYVLNGHDGGSIQGYLVLGDHLLRVPSWHRALGLDPTQLNFTESPGQVGFSPDGTKLIVTTKANGNNIDVFPLGRFGGLTGAPVVTNDPGGVPFAFTWDPQDNLVITTAGTASVDTYRLDGDGTLTSLSSAPTGQKGTCWVVADGRRLFATNPGSASVTSLVTHAGGQLSVVAQTATDAGTVDPVVSADGHYLYVETGAAGIVDEYLVHGDATLTPIGSVTVAGAAGAEGIAAS